MLHAPLDAGQNLARVPEGTSPECQQTFHHLILTSEGVGNVLRMTTDVLVRPSHHFFFKEGHIWSLPTWGALHARCCTGS